MTANILFADLATDLHTIICKYNRKAIFVLPKDQLIKYNWKFLIKAVHGVSFDMSTKNIISNYYEMSKSKKIYYGGQHTIIRLNNGTLMACGRNYYGQLGLGDNVDRYNFEEIKGIPKNVVSVIVSDSYTIIRLSNGILMGCGDNLFGQLGDMGGGPIFKEIKGIPNNIADVYCGKHHTVIRLTNGTLMGCGCNHYGQLGLGDCIQRKIFEEIKNIPKNIVDVTCGADHTIIRLSSGVLMSCGSNYYGQLGLGDTKDRSLFEEIKGIPNNVVGVACGDYHTVIKLGGCKVKKIADRKNKPQNTGILMSCGNNNLWQLGVGDQKNRSTFEEMKNIPGNIVDVKCCSQSTIIKLNDGTIMVNKYNFETSVWEFREYNCIPKNVYNIVYTNNNIIIRLDDGTLMARGSNKYGELGIGDKKHRYMFEEIKSIPKKLMID